MPPPVCGGAQLSVLAVDVNGAVTGLGVLDYGAYYSIPTVTPNTVSGGSGSGCTLNLTWQLFWPNAAWYVPAQTDLYQVMAAEVLVKFDANLTPNPNPPGTPVDYSLPTRSGGMLFNYVDQIRQAVQTGNKVPLSVTLNSIPPEAVPHVLNMTAWQLANSTPSIQFAVLTEKGSSSPLLSLYEAGQKWMEAVRKGLTVTYPSDPDPGFLTPTRVGSIGTPADLESYSASSLIGFPTSQIGFP